MSAVCSSRHALPPFCAPSPARPPSPLRAAGSGATRPLTLAIAAHCLTMPPKKQFSHPVPEGSWVERTYERLIGIPSEQQPEYTHRFTWANTPSATDRDLAAPPRAASSSSQMPSQSPALEENPEFEDFIRIRRDLGMAPVHFQPQRYTHIVEGRPVQALVCSVLCYSSFLLSQLRC